MEDSAVFGLRRPRQLRRLLEKPAAETCHFFDQLLVESVHEARAPETLDLIGERSNDGYLCPETHDPHLGVALAVVVGPKGGDGGKSECAHDSRCRSRSRTLGFTKAREVRVAPELDECTKSP